MSESINNIKKSLFGKKQRQPGIVNVLNAIATDYSAVFVTDTNINEGKLVVLGDMFRSVLKKYNIELNIDANFFDYIDKLNSTLVHEDDREVLIKFMFGKELRKRIAAGKESSIIIRADLGHNLRHIEIKVIPYDNNSPYGVVVGIKDIEKEYHYHEDDRLTEFQRQKREEEYKYASVIAELSEKYEYVGYFLYGTKELESLYISDDVIDEYDNTDKTMPPYKRIIELFKRLVYPADEKYFLAHLTKEEIFEHIKKDGKYKFECRFIHHGKVMYYQLKFSEATQRKDAIIFALANIDVEKRSEQKQALQEAMIRNLEDKAVITGLCDDYDAIMFVTNNGEGEDDTASIYRMNEKIASAIPGWHSSESFREKLILLSQNFVYPDDETEFVARTRKMVVLSHVKNEPAYFVEFRAVLEGKISTYQIKFVADRDEDNIITGFIVGISNVDEQIHSKNIIKVLADNYEMVCSVYTTREEIEIYRASGAFSFFSKYLSWDSKVMSSKQFDEGMRRVVHPDYLEDLLNQVNREKIMELMEKGYTGYADFKGIKRGKTEWYRIEFAYDKSTGNITVGIRNVESEHTTSDLLEQQKFELEKKQEELKKALDMAHSSNRAKTTFLNSMSHDIRTPMNAIIGYTGLARNHISNEKQVEDYLEKINQASEHLLALINEVLDMSRIESGKLSIKGKEEDLYRVVKSFSDMIQANVKEKNLDYSLNFKISNEYVIFDKLRVEQIMLNIISNSIKYTNEGGSIEFDITQKQCEKSGYGLYEFKVKDSGIGMDEEFLENIFEPFTREQSATMSGIQGTGLGMSIVKNIVDLMGGIIKVESMKNVGTTVTVLLEFKIADSNKNTDVEILNECDSFEGKTILVVEDNDFNLEIALELLNDNKINTLVARNGKDALEAVKKSKIGAIDAVLMDIQMPLMDGYEATRQIRALKDENRANIPIIAMTANAFEEDKNAAFEAGMNEHIAKPINVEILKGILKKYIK